ncbi:pilus assembly PilX N-terminal domain-containing protein [Lutibacter sp. B2]|nr:pilus assembly PilX N-terminal domain-containing protein [Lutibacter sp. B2]
MKMSLLKLEPLRKKNKNICELLKKQDGSTLVMVLIYMTILSMLGITILSVSLTNMKMKLVDQKVKKSFYGAEAGIEEAHARIEKQVKEAIDYGDKVVEKNLEYLKEHDYTYESKKYKDEEGIIQQEELKDDMGTWFEEAYKEFLNSKVTPKDISILDIDDKSYEYNYLIDILAANNYQFRNIVTINEDDITKFSESSNTFDIIVHSQNSSSDDIKKQISKKFSIKIPKYNPTTDETVDESYYKPVYVSRDTKYLYNLDMIEASGFTDNAVTAKGDIILEEGAKVTIHDGHVYAKGNIIEKESTEEKKGNLTVNGNTMTQKDILTDGAYTSMNFNGDVYCKTLKISENSSHSSLQVGTKADNINQKFRVFTEDDLELNGDNSSIEIYGSYYGFTDGSLETTDSDDESSAIVINSKDIGKGSTLTITGEESSNNEFTDGIIIGGTAYLNFTNKPYQTGESVAIHGNYLGYTKGILNLNNEIFSIDKYNYAFKDYNFSEYNYVDAKGNKINIDLADTYNDSKTTLYAKDKGRILGKLSETKPFTIQTGGKNGIDLGTDTIIYATGAYITKDKMKADKIAYGDYGTLKYDLKNEYDTKTTDKDISYSSEFIKDEATINKEDNAICYINNNDVAIVGENGSAPKGISNVYRVGSNFNSNNIKGIIITDGNVYISGEVTFRGIIAAKGNIIFTDNNQKNIYLDNKVEIKKIEEVVGISNDVNTYSKYSSLIETSSWKTE